MENQRNHQGEMVDKETANKTNKHLERKKNSRFRNNRISVLVVLVLLLQYPVLVLVFITVLVSLGGWGDWSDFFPVFQLQLLSHLLPQ
jgi:hypothetical protein